MPFVTDIRKQKRNDTRYSIYVGDKYTFSLSDLELSNSGLRVGAELSSDMLNELISSSVESKAYNAAITQLSYRRRSTKEITDYLQRKDFSAETIKSVVEKLSEISMINDMDFAKAWVADRQLLRPRSKKVLMLELMKKGISRDDYAEALNGVSAESQAKTLDDLIEKKLNSTQYKDKNKLIAYLARSGYSYNDIKLALARLEEAS